MALTDHHDIFIGSTGDGWTFLVLNRPLRNAARILTGAGFTAREHQGRTLYLLPPEAAEDAHERAGVAAFGLMAHTLDLVGLAWTTRQHGASPDAQPDVTIRFTEHAVAATAATGQAGAVLVPDDTGAEDHGQPVRRPRPVVRKWRHPLRDQPIRRAQGHGQGPGHRERRHPQRPDQARTRRGGHHNIPAPGPAPPRHRRRPACPRPAQARRHARPNSGRDASCDQAGRRGTHAITGFALTDRVLVSPVYLAGPGDSTVARPPAVAAPAVTPGPRH